MVESWNICIDTGGTFTDCWAVPPGGTEPVLVKVLSSGKLRVRVVGESRIQVPWQLPSGFFEGWQIGFADQTARIAQSTVLADGLHQLSLEKEAKLDSETDLFTGEEAPVIGARILTQTCLNDSFPAISLRLATTRGTNALLEKKGARTAFFVTQGFGDLLRIRDQRRPDLFALNHQIPEPLYDAVFEIPERLDAGGAILEPLDLDHDLCSKISALVDDGIEVAAIALMHSYLNDQHEQELAGLLKKAGFKHVSLSSELAPLIKLLPRAETAVVDAYLTPVMDEFLNRVSRVTDDLLVMTSAGGLEPNSDFRPKDSLFSGPAGGVVGAAASGKLCGFEKLITFDMGGTSTDVARYDGDFAYQFQQAIGATTLLSPSLRIETVAAGGGSICQWSEGGLRVGPESAGSVPGPACYGQGGPLTITDVNVLLGRVDPDNFGIPLGDESIAAAKARLQELMREMGTNEPEEEVLEGLLRIAVEQMADSIGTISIREGANPSDYALLAFGGAGPLHACAIADRLGMSTILVPAEAGVLSAFGLHHAEVERFAERQVLHNLADCPQIEDWLGELRDEAAEKLGTESQVRRRIAELRLSGQEAPLDLEIDDADQLATQFRAKYRTVFGYEPQPSQPIELVSLRVVVSKPQTAKVSSVRLTAKNTAPKESGPFLNRAALSPGDQLSGPRIIQDPFSTLFLQTGWSATVHETGSLILRRVGDAASVETATATDSPLVRELFRHRFQNIVEEMGAMLQRSAVSTNVKERMDFSCALLDAEGQLVVNAPHIPVHLGALGLCVREVAKHLELGPGDIAITNHPGFGGSHLPDVTLITAIFEAGQRIGYVANRAHHAEIGGIRPGSMPPNAQNLEEEGVVIAPMLLFEGGNPKWEQIEEILTHSPHPTRKLADNLADLQAQAAANLRGAQSLEALVAEHGGPLIRLQLESLAEQSRASFHKALKSQSLAENEAEEKLDDGTVIRVAAKHENERFVLDFTGTSATVPGNFSATPAIVRSAILYCLRLWTGSDLPLNEGLLRDVSTILPRCFLNPEFPANPRECPAVVGGNVETSQRVVDTILKLFGIQACSQGTMNNFIFGNDRFGYYETIAGGAGAGPDHEGASGLHTHMTNTAITDPEILEKRYPILLRQFAIRKQSGGKGRFAGGDGVIREFQFREPLEVSLLMQHRIEPPYGLNGGEPGSLGTQHLIRCDGETVAIPGIAAIEVQEGERIVIETPGGGGFGVA
tara:strand:+ start:8925 stop:12620 length:3696 start_codon:yes stop_codon:yes gene_type:complete